MLKQYFLIFICGFFDFFEFTLSMKSLSPFFNLSGSLERRLSGVLTITSSLSLMLVLKYKILKHQKVSLIILSATLGIIIITEFIYQRIDIFLTYGDLITLNTNFYNHNYNITSNNISSICNKIFSCFIHSDI